MNAIIFDDYYSPKICEENPQLLFVFGDNIIRKGTGGQACIRYMKNSKGIATKRLPTMNHNAFFSDLEEEGEIIYNDFMFILNYAKMYNLTICFPRDGLGTGLSKMPEKSPLLFKYLNNLIEQYYGIVFDYELQKFTME